MPGHKFYNFLSTTHIKCISKNGNLHPEKSFFDSNKISLNQTNLCLVKDNFFLIEEMS